MQKRIALVALTALVLVWLGYQEYRLRRLESELKHAVDLVERTSELNTKLRRLETEMDQLKAAIDLSIQTSRLNTESIKSLMKDRRN